jgi:hypothetical protein
VAGCNSNIDGEGQLQPRRPSSLDADVSVPELLAGRYRAAAGEPTRVDVHVDEAGISNDIDRDPMPIDHPYADSNCRRREASVIAHRLGLTRPG